MANIPIATLFGQNMFHHQHSVLEFCEKLHMFCSGAAEYREAFEPFYMKTYLIEKLNNWIKTSQVFDAIVSSLICQTLTEYARCSWAPTLEDAKACYDLNPEYWNKEIKKLTRC